MKIKQHLLLGASVALDALPVFGPLKRLRDYVLWEILLELIQEMDNDDRR